MTAPETNSASCEAGYGKPPRRTQFKTGQSGNPDGRPQGRTAGRVEELALHDACCTVTVKEDGQAAPLSAIQALLRSQIQMAASGNVRAQCAILTVILDVERAAAVEARLAARYEPVDDVEAAAPDNDEDDDADPDGEDEAADVDGDEDDDADLDDDEDDEDDEDEDEDDDESEADEIDTDVERQEEDGE
jgi:hypothetical protein